MNFPLQDDAYVSTNLHMISDFWAQVKVYETLIMNPLSSPTTTIPWLVSVCVANKPLLAPLLNGSLCLGHPAFLLNYKELKRMQHIM